MPNKQVTQTPAEVVRAGRKIREIRLGMFGTLKDAEDKTGIAFQTLSQLERGDMTKPSLELLTKVSAKFRIPLQTIISWYGYEAYYGEK